MPPEKTKDAGASRPGASPPLANAEKLTNKPVQDLTIRECEELAVFYYERYMWQTDAQDDLWVAAMLRYVADEAKKRVPDWWRTIGEASDGGDKFAFIDENIFGMVAHFSCTPGGRDILDIIIRSTGLGDWDSRE